MGKALKHVEALPESQAQALLPGADLADVGGPISERGDSEEEA